MNIASELVRWYKQNKRDLPWRETRDPYVIWLSEIILQQTRVEQGLPYFYRFLEAFPTIHDFAKAPESKILKLWQGLGYYSRARNMHATARTVVKEYHGNFPADYKELLKLKGIGEYTASAIASFAFSLPYPVVDGNVFRFLSRYYGIKTPINSSSGKKEFTELAMQLIDKNKPGLFNQAMMEFGALHCKPQNPLCESCPFNMECVALSSNTIADLPVKIKSLKPRDRYFNYLYISHKDHFYLRKRTRQDIWKHLYELPLIETGGPVNAQKLVRIPELFSLAGSRTPLLREMFTSRHKLSHQTIHATFFSLKEKSKAIIYLQKNFTKIPTTDLQKYPYPRLIERFFNKLFEENS